MTDILAQIIAAVSGVLATALVKWLELRLKERMRRARTEREHGGEDQ